MKGSKVRIGSVLVLVTSLLMMASTSGQDLSQEKPGGEKQPAVTFDPAALARLIKQLGSDDFQTREKASRQLAELEEIPEALHRAEQDSDREVSRRAHDAISIITNRAEERALQVILRDLRKVELDRFVRRMVTDKKFASDKQYKIIEAVAKTVIAEANKSAGRPLLVPDFAAMKSRLLLNAEIKNPASVPRSVLLSAGATPYIINLSNSFVIVDGDFTGATGISNSLLIVRGNVGRVMSVQNSILLATGDWEGAISLSYSFVQVNNDRIRFTSAEDSVLINSQIRTIGGTNSRVLKTDEGPLKLLKFSPRPPDARLVWSEEINNLTVALAPLDASGQFLIRWKNVGKDDLQLPWVRFHSGRINGDRDDLLGHVFLKGPDGKLAVTKQADRVPMRFLLPSPLRERGRG